MYSGKNNTDPKYQEEEIEPKKAPPRNAYIIFMIEEVRKIKNELDISHREAFKIGAERWTKLSQEQKQYYESTAQNNREQYKLPDSKKKEKAPPGKKMKVKYDIKQEKVV